MGLVSSLISQRTFRIWGLAAILVVAMGALAGGIAFGTTTTCSNPATLSGSAFEVDPAPLPQTNTGANLIVNTTGCIDWLSGGTGTSLRSGVVAKNDTPSGAADESFGNGTKEDTANPSIVDGGIPPNKSDLKAFGVYPEQGTVTTSNPTGKFLALFWTRVQDPSGTTNMDFELNQKFCDGTAANCATNLVTPKRTGDGAGPLTDDKLITYDLSNGGTVATISIRSWNGSAWGSPSVISGGANANALGSINTSLIPANQAGGATNGLTTQLGPLDPRTFGEATISFSALFGQNTCGQFGSAYLKSRSSDSFTAALKDFVPPTRVSISNCSSLTTNATQSVTIGSSIKDTATLSGATSNATGTIAFKLYGPFTGNDPSQDQCTADKLVFQTVPSPGTPSHVPIGSPNAQGNYVVDSPTFTPTAVGRYQWVASYSGDSSNQSASSDCRAANEASVVNAASPQITTTPDPSEGTVGVTLNDSAELSGGVNPQGSIEFKLFAPGDEDCSGTPVFTQSVDVNGNDTYNTTGGYPSDATGIYRWTATYTSSNANNSNAESGCQDEQVTISPAEATIETAQELFPQDSATISATAGGRPTGTVTFTLYAGPDCSGTPAYPAETVQLTDGDTPNTSTANTNNTSFSVDEASSGDYKWIVEYSGDDTHDGVTSECGEEAFTATIDNDTTP
jgi:hypothetical protein